MNPSDKVLVLGASGMLGGMVFKFLLAEGVAVYGTYRKKIAVDYFERNLNSNLYYVDASSEEELSAVIDRVRPKVVINCIGLVKQLNLETQPLAAINLNARLPHLLEKICKKYHSRLILFSTDCVFSGKKGMYNESDEVDAQDIYGVSKYLGEVKFSSSVLTLRTSIIGPEPGVGHSLLNWFLRQESHALGYRKAIFSGITTIEMARVLKELILPNDSLHGLYHLSGEPISKYNLLLLIAGVYKKEIIIVPDDHIAIDRSLDSRRFKTMTGYQSKPWSILIKEMHQETIE